MCFWFSLELTRYAELFAEDISNNVDWFGVSTCALPVVELNIKSPEDGVVIELRCVVVSRGSIRPLLVLTISRAAFDVGAVVPTPIEP